jgi:hypothetical protein
VAAMHRCTAYAAKLENCMVQAAVFSTSRMNSALDAMLDTCGCKQSITVHHMFNLTRSGDPNQEFTGGS